MKLSSYANISTTIVKGLALIEELKKDVAKEDDSDKFCKLASRNQRSLVLDDRV